MTEYIEREALLLLIEERKLNTCNGTVSCLQMQRMVERIPAADVAPVRHGRWKYYKKQGIAVCTECSFERNLDENFGRAIACPNCGARCDLGGADNG